MRHAAASHAPRSGRAFSLVEVLVAATLLVAGLAALLVAITVAMSLHEHQRKVAAAVVIAEAQMENLLLLFPGSTELTDGRHPASGFVGFEEDGRPGGAAFRSFYVARPVTPVGVALDLTIAWDERSGEKSFQLSTVR
jgi:type II secretory pathway pseudopilin PulG